MTLRDLNISFLILHESKILFTHFNQSKLPSSSHGFIILHYADLLWIFGIYPQSPILLPSFFQTFSNPSNMSQSKSASSQGADAKDKGTPAPPASSKATKTGEPEMGKYRVSFLSLSKKHVIMAHSKSQDCHLNTKVRI